MLNCLLNIVAGGDGNFYFENKWSEAAIYALIGFAIVFAGIIVIILIIWLEGLLMRKTNNLAFLSVWGQKIRAFFVKIFKRRKKQPNVSIVKTETSSDEEISPEIVAAITAALAVYYGGEKPKCEFKVKRIKRIKE